MSKHEELSSNPSTGKKKKKKKNLSHNISATEKLPLFQQDRTSLTKEKHTLIRNISI
jgi:hypothetical protein